MRPRAVALLCRALAVLLVLLQHGAVLHELAHVPRAGGHEMRLSDHVLLHQGPCEVCLAYAAVGTVPPAASSPPLRPAGVASPPGPSPVFAAAAVAAYAARAPPSLLV